MQLAVFNSIFIRIIVGFIIGSGLSFIGTQIEKILLKKRELELVRVKYEKYIILVTTGIFGSVVMWRMSYSINAIYLFVLLIIGQVIVLSDTHHRIIPNDTLLAILIVKLAFGIPYLLGIKGFPQFNVPQSILGMVVSFVIFVIPSFMGNNIGLGDVKLAGCVGFCLGLLGSMAAIVLMGMFELLYTVLQRKEPILIMLKNMLPMGPFMIFGMMAVLLFIPDSMMFF